jgi:hypothetical protein
MANCIFASTEIPPRAPADTRTRTHFSAGEPIWARCYLPDRAGANRPGDLVDEIWLDGQKLWSQAYDAALPTGALERSIALSEILRTPLATLGRGLHRLRIVGTLKRGGRVERLYRGELELAR